MEIPAEESAEAKATREAAELKAFHALDNYAEKHAYFHAHPSLHRKFSTINFEIPPAVSVKE